MKVLRSILDSRETPGISASVPSCNDGMSQQVALSQHVNLKCSQRCKLLFATIVTNYLWLTCREQNRTRAQHTREGRGTGPTGLFKVHLSRGATGGRVSLRLWKGQSERDSRCVSLDGEVFICSTPTGQDSSWICSPIRSTLSPPKYCATQKATFTTLISLFYHQKLKKEKKTIGTIKWNFMA